MSVPTKMKIYNHSPIFMQNLICTMIGRKLNRIRYGKNFDTWIKFYEKSAAWSEEELKEYQREKMIELIYHCFSSVPYYKKKFISKCLTPKDLKSLDDISKFPYTTKEEVFYNREQMISDKYNHKELLKSMTSGSTGMPLTQYFTQNEMEQHYAIFWNRMRQGVSRGDRYASFQGKGIVPLSQKTPPFWRENFAANQRYYSMRHLSRENLKYYAEDLSNQPFVYYQGYVSIMTIIAEYMEENCIHLSHPLKAVFSTSENLSMLSRNLFERVWKTKVWDEYCQAECCALIRQCEFGNHHPQMDYGIIEYEPIEYQGDYILAEIVCTGFIPFASPLIRYRIGDLVLLHEKGKCPCGAPGPLIKEIYGRSSDYILTPDGRKYPCGNVGARILRNVRRSQIIQEDENRITIRLVPFPEFGEKDEKHIIKSFKENIGCEINVVVEKVNELERIKGGKVLSIIHRKDSNTD
jgi:phenylacetate-CoA ligase